MQKYPNNTVLIGGLKDNKTYIYYLVQGFDTQLKQYQVQVVDTDKHFSINQTMLEDTDYFLPFPQQHNWAGDDGKGI